MGVRKAGSAAKRKGVALTEREDAFARTLARLSALGDESDYDAGFSAPCPGVCQAARDLLVKVAGSVGREVPPAGVTPDGDGGLRLRWSTGSREVRIALPTEDPSEGTLYFQEGQDYGGREGVTAAELAKRLNWLTRE